MVARGGRSPDFRHAYIANRDHHACMSGMLLLSQAVPKPETPERSAHSLMNRVRSVRWPSRLRRKESSYCVLCLCQNLSKAHRSTFGHWLSGRACRGMCVLQKHRAILAWEARDSENTYSKAIAWPYCRSNTEQLGRHRVRLASNSISRSQTCPVLRRQLRACAAATVMSAFDMHRNRS